jgi:hypothetical protein
MQQRPPKKGPNHDGRIPLTQRINKKRRVLQTYADVINANPIEVLTRSILRSPNQAVKPYKVAIREGGAVEGVELQEGHRVEGS